MKGHKVLQEWKDKCKEKDNWQRGEERYNYKGITYQKGRRFITLNGRRVKYTHYVWCNQPNNHPYVPQGFVIHHVNGNKLDDRPNNLELLPRDIHLKLHNPLQHRWKN